ncbi:hypothetical protein BG005_004481 [Podila minutissima]|nr:hypothetical protein BG005_004481 [Podila minutissima]
MNTTQYGYHSYPSPSQTQAQVHSQLQDQQLQQQQQQQHQPDALSPSLQHHHQQQQQQQQPQQQHTQQLSPQQSPVSPHHSPEAHSPNIHTSHGPQSPIDAEGELILPSPGSSTSSSGHHGMHHIKVESQANPTISGVVTALSTTTSAATTSSSLLPMPSPALAAATAANTAANTNPSASRQAILQQMQQQQQQQQQQQMHMGSLPMGNGTTTINTAMMGLPTGYMLPSPVSAGTQSLPALPPQSADLDSILAKYASQPELLKLIIASKTEEDRRWAEEARYRMMDLIMRGENRGLGFAAGYEALGGITGPGGNMMGTKRFMEEGYAHSGFAGFPPSSGGVGGAPGVGAAGPTGGTTVLTSMSPSSTAGSSAGLPSMYAQSQIGFGVGGMSSQMMGQGTAGGQAFSYVDPSLARKRSVTFAGEVHQHMRSQSLSSIPTPSTLGQLSGGAGGGGMPMLGMTDFSQHGYHTQHPQMAYHLQQQQQQQQQQLGLHFPHQQALPPQFGQYSGQHQFGSQHSMPSMHHSSIRRTNSLSHINGTTVTEQRLAAGRPRNESAASIRTMDDDSDEESDEDDHHWNMSSRPGSALSMNNNMGGNGETSLTLEFSGMASVSGDHSSSYDHHHHHNNNHNTSSVVPTLSSGSTTSTNSGSTPSSSSSNPSGAITTTTTINSNSSGGLPFKGLRAMATTLTNDYKRKRKRREMQPVNKIVDSPEPHIDPYLWKNNGNTIQKKTGCKSIYYKCSNSTAGCTVNKTVTEKEGGGYVTKYRGEHLDECIRLKKAQMAAQAAQAALNGQSI